MSVKKILIGGGTGFIGQHLTKLLTTAGGYDVTIISRMPGLKRITWHDLSNNGLPNDVHAVVNLAGQNVLDPSRRWTPGFKQNVWNSRINSSMALIRAIHNTKRENKPSVFINVSGVSLYKPNPQKIYTEIDLGEDYDFMSRLCVHWEKAATLIDEDDKTTRGVKIRCGVVIGRNGGMIQSIKLPFLFGLGGPMGTGNQYLPWIHIDDICNLIKYSIEESTVNGILNGVAPDIITNMEFSKTYASVLCRPAIFTVPEFIINVLFGKERAVLLTTGPKISPVRTQQLGYKFRYPTIREACEEVCNKLKKK